MVRPRQSKSCNPTLAPFPAFPNFPASYDADIDVHRELDKLNRTPFFIPVGPGKKARNKEVEATMERHREERERREQTRRDGYAMNQRMEETSKELYRDQPRQLLGTSKNVDRSKFMYEEDDEDIQDEEEMDQKLQIVAGLAGKMNVGARLIGEDIDRSIDRLDRIGAKVKSIRILLFARGSANILSQTEVVDDRVSPFYSESALKTKPAVGPSHGELLGSPNVQCGRCECQTNPAEKHPFLFLFYVMKLTNMRETGSYEQSKTQPDSLRIAGKYSFSGVTSIKTAVLVERIYFCPQVSWQLTARLGCGLVLYAALLW